MDLAAATTAPPVSGPPPVPREDTAGAATFESHLKTDLAARENTNGPEQKAEEPTEATAEPTSDQPPLTPVLAANPAAAAIDLQLLGGPQPETDTAEEASPSAALAPTQAARPVQPQPQTAKPLAPKSAPPPLEDGATTGAPVEASDAGAPAPSSPAAQGIATPAQNAAPQGAAPAPPAMLVAAQAAAQTAKPASSAPEAQAAKPVEATSAKPDAPKRGAEAAAKTSGNSAAPEQQIKFEIAAAQLSLAEPNTASSSDLQVASAGTAASGTHQTAAAETGRTAPAAAQVASEIIRRFTGKSTQFDLRLDPPELGRVEVRLEVSRDHRVTATVTADNPQALAELARHARELQQTLQSAGLELSDAGLSFDLRQGREGARELVDEAAREGSPLQSEDDEIRLPPIQARPAGLERWRGVRVDVVA